MNDKTTILKKKSYNNFIKSTDPTNAISLEKLTDIVNNLFVDVKVKERSQRRSIERLRKVKEELQVLYG